MPPAFDTYRNLELLLNAASIGPAGVVAATASDISRPPDGLAVNDETVLSVVLVA